MGDGLEHINSSLTTMKTISEKRNQIIQILPGGDCGGKGGCKCESCQECAQSISEGAFVALCPACSQAKIDEIAKIMGVESPKGKDEIAFIRCSNEADGKKKSLEFSSCDDSIKAGFLEGECEYGCLGIGSCVELCKFNAMALIDGAVIIDKEKCNGCGACIGICPQELITMIPREASNYIPCAAKYDEEKTRSICGSGCTGCGECEEVCPVSAIAIIDNCAIIDYDKCIGCVACTVKCSKKIIIDDLHDLTKIKDRVAFVRCEGGKKGNDIFKALGIEDCKTAAEIRDETMEICQVGCTGLGNCVKVCRFDAIKVVKGTAKIDPDKCVGCLDCVAACPVDLIIETPYIGSKLVACASTDHCDQQFNICTEGCIGCGDCQANCPNNAITMKDSYAVIDTSLCENCSICVYMCSRNAIVEMIVPESNYLQCNALRI